MWRLTKYIIGLDNEDLGVRNAEDIEHLVELLKEEFHAQEIQYEKNMYAEKVYTIHFKSCPNVIIIALHCHP